MFALQQVADFDQLVEMLNFAVAIAMLLEFAAFIKLRITDDDGKCIGYRIAEAGQSVVLKLKATNIWAHFGISITLLNCHKWNGRIAYL